MSEGLKRSEKLEPGAGYLNALGGWESGTGPFAEAEVGYRALPNAALYGAARWTPNHQYVGGGVRVSW